jgi:hypothetical protein
MAGFASYNRFKTEVQNTLSSEAPPSQGGYGLTYAGLYPFSNASWMKSIGQGPGSNQGNTPGERNQTIQCASFTSVKDEGSQTGGASKFFYSISPNINNTQPPTGSWTNSRNAIGLNFGGRAQLLTSLTPNNKLFFTPIINAGGGLPPGGSVTNTGAGNTGGGNTGGGNTGGGNTGGGNTGGGVGNVLVGGQTGVQTGGGNTGGFAGGGVAGGGGQTYSDVRLKENINKIGISNSGIPVYQFNYKGSSERYRGTMAQDLIKLGKLEAINKDNKGFYMVDYNKIDVEFTKI